MDKRHHPLDDLFRQGLTNLEINPTDAGRSGFLENADRELKKRSRRSGWLPGIGIILGLALLTGSFLVIFNTGEKQNHKNSIGTRITNQTAPEKISKPFIISSNLEPSHSAKIGTIPKQNVQPDPVPPNSIPEIRTPHSQQVPLTSSSYLTSRSIAASPSIIPQTSQTSSVQENRTTSVNEKVTHEPLKPAGIDSFANNSIQSGDSIKNHTETGLTKNAGHQTSGSVQNRDWNISVGIYYTPEWIFNTLDNNKYVNNFGIETQFRFGPYSVKTGIGLSITRGFNELVIETRPYLGGYKALDYITYHWDSRHYHLLPTYYTTWKEVYDTALHKDYYTLEKEYTYLQIPMILGYDFLTEKWVSLGARAGPVMSLLLKTRELTSEYDAGKDQVISINKVTPDRIHLNWQAMGGINASFHLSRLIIFEVEPELRYYFNSVYEKSGPSGKPWSAGIHAAFLLSF